MAAILLVSERPEAVRETKAALESDGHEVVFASDRFQAVGAAVDRRFTVAILFLRAASREMWELIPLLGRLDSRLPILTIAEKDSIEAQREIRRSKVFYHLAHPVDVEELRQALGEAFAHRGSK